MSFLVQITDAVLQTGHTNSESPMLSSSMYPLLTMTLESLEAAALKCAGSQPPVAREGSKKPAAKKRGRPAKTEEGTNFAEAGGNMTSLQCIFVLAQCTPSIH